MGLFQVLWQNTFEMGCDYEICNATNSSDYSYAMVSCNYGATGNIAGSAAFDESIYENINNNENFTGRFGHLPRCEVNSIEEVQPQVRYGQVKSIWVTLSFCHYKVRSFCQIKPCFVKSGHIESTPVETAGTFYMLQARSDSVMSGQVKPCQFGLLEVKVRSS